MSDLSATLRVIAPELVGIKLPSLSALTIEAADTIDAQAARIAELEGERVLRPMDEAPTHDRQFILAKVRDDAWPEGERFGHYSGRWFVPFHEGTMDSGYDLGWGLFPGFGGVSSHMFEGWMPLPKEPTQ